MHGVLMKSLGNILYPVGLVRILVRGAYIFHRQESAAAVFGNLNPKPRTLELSYHSGSQEVTNLGGVWGYETLLVTLSFRVSESLDGKS